MISFFRKIRQNLFAENKFSKYLIYAIGEIALVMIGILLALQVNNWNEAKKANLEEMAILKSIKIDFQNVIAECQENNIFRERVLNATNALYDLINFNNRNYTKTQLDSIMAVLFINPTYNNQTGSLDVLFNSGKINLIHNSDIKEKLIAWPQQIDDVKEDEQYASEHLRGSLYGFIRKYVSVRDINLRIDYKDLKMFNRESESKFTSNYEGLFNDIEFEGILGTRELPVAVSLIQTNDLIETAQSIIALIDKELEKGTE